MAARTAAEQKKIEAAWQEIIDSIPGELEFQLPMVADSSAWTYVDVDTGLGDGEAMVIYGMEWVFESTTAATMLAGSIIGAAGDDIMCLQVQRGTDLTDKAHTNNNKVALQHLIGSDIVTSGIVPYEMPFRMQKRTISYQSKFRIGFKTTTDIGDISETTIRIAGKILHDVVDAPDVGATKLGRLSDL